MIITTKNVMLTLMLFLLAPANAFSTAIDLSSWSSPDSNGSWELSSDHTSVTQTRNGYPTMFLSDTTYINTIFNGTLITPCSWDDDFIGLVFGYQDSHNYFLFDWKQSTQGSAPEGFTLSKITGSDRDLWSHTGHDITVLDTKYGDDQGWSDSQSYSFTLEYTNDNIKIFINSTEIFDVNGTFSAGKLGFYNYSQSYVTYQGVDQRVAPVPEPSTFLLFGIGVVGLAGIGVRRFKNKSSE